MSTWADDRRKDKDADSKRRLEEKAAENAERRAERKERDARAQKRRDRSRAQRGQTVTRIRGWFGEHLVDLVVYPLAVISAWMAIPSMAAYGRQIYGSAAGIMLPGLTELGMWSFALAVQISRHRYPERPVWALQLGLVSFALAGCGMNALHGYTTGGIQSAIVMAVVSVAGVLAHQLVVAAPRRSPAERAKAKLIRQQLRKLNRAAARAAKHAPVQVDPDGTVRLIHRTGYYDVGTFSRLFVNPRGEGGKSPKRGVARRLATPATPATLPPGEGPQTDLDRELQGLLEAEKGGPPSTGISIADLDQTSTHPRLPASTDPSTGPSTDRGRSKPQSRSQSRSQSRADQGKRGSNKPRSNETTNDLVERLRKMVKLDPTSVDVTSAESIRKALGIGWKRGKEVLDVYRLR
jgi:hypothetical protein